MKGKGNMVIYCRALWNFRKLSFWPRVNLFVLTGLIAYV